MAYWDQPVNSRQLAGKRDNPQRSTQSPNAQGERGSIDRLQQLASTASSATSRATDVVPMACWDQPVYSRHLPEDKQDRTDLDMQAHFPPHAQHGFHPPPAEGTRPMSVVPPSYWNKPAASTQPAMQRKNTQSSVQTPSAQTPKAPSASAAKPAGVQEAPKAAPFVPPKGMPVVCWAPSGPDSMDVEQARPQLVDANCQRVLRYVIYQQEQISLWPPAVVTSLVQLLLMVLQTVMDHLEAAGSLAYSNAASEACFLYLSAGLCTQHCLETLPVNDDVLTSCQEADREAILQAVGDCRAQATSLVDNLADRAVRLHMDALYSVILAEINSLPWRAYRTAMCHSTGPGYAVRLWRLMLHSTLHGLCQVCPLTSAVGLFAETLLRQLKVLASAYLKLAPSQQWLPRYVADVAYVVATVFSFAESGSSGQGTVQTALSQICRRMCMHAGLLCTSAEALAALVTATTPPTVFGAPSGWAWLDPEDILRLSARLPDLACPFRPLAAADVSDDWEARLGASWRALVAHMAGQASREQALTALAFRHELLAEIPGLTYSPEQLQARRLLAQLASQQPQLVRTATLPA
ncbi:hypothetical protein WJX72_011048 [[Myrmecia] bisecta]|uniref:Uncharacterized protein n=1 Tax=[Myrmecia] bisecta TaxID=41462 RepID=A0AAW1QSR1_9CHLO